MYPQFYVVDHRIGPGRRPAEARHMDRPHVRRGQPEVLQIDPGLHDAPHGPAFAPIPVLLDDRAHRALLIELAQDPRFARRVAAPRRARPALRIRLGQALMRMGWWLVRNGADSGRQAG